MTRQEVYYFGPPNGDERFAAGRLPVWADFNGGDIVYGLPDLEGRGFKIAFDRHGPPADPNGMEREPSSQGIAMAREFIARRFPALADAPLVQARVCQYTNSSSGDFLIDWLPGDRDVLLVGGDLVTASSMAQQWESVWQTSLFQAHSRTNRVSRWKPRVSSRIAKSTSPRQCYKGQVQD